MDDLISRQMAIDSLTEIIMNLKNMYGDMGSAVNGARECIKSLPSVEPEQKWIPVTERLPEYGERVLTTTEVGSRGKKVRSGTYTKNLFQCDNGDVWTVTDKEVLAWMHCPEPWRDE